MATTPSPELDSDDELSAFVLQHFIIISSWQSEKKQKEWSAPIYAFFEPVPRNIEVEGWPAHEFKCSARGCKGTVRRYLDTKDAGSTGNLRRHARSCWGADVVKAADDARNVDDVRTKIWPGLLKDGSITTAFKRKGNGQVTYSHRQHTRQETKGFKSLMKTGRPEYYLPSRSTVSRDVRLVFACTRNRIAKMLQEHSGKINFTTDAWMSPNHRAFIAFSVHLEHKGKSLTMPLDIIEV
ncbi:hypothetical protein SCLCIDRAFT_143510, partial [Scleroderma citrinum Foug A]